MEYADFDNWDDEEYDYDYISLDLNKKIIIKVFFDDFLNFCDFLINNGINCERPRASFIKKSGYVIIFLNNKKITYMPKVKNNITYLKDFFRYNYFYDFNKKKFINIYDLDRID